jgi:hypothetical protein
MKPSALRRRRPAVPVACERVSWMGWERLYRLRRKAAWTQRRGLPLPLFAPVLLALLPPHIVRILL